VISLAGDSQTTSGAAVPSADGIAGTIILGTTTFLKRYEDNDLEDSTTQISEVVLLAGGLGTRLSEETELRPKPMMEIAGGRSCGTS
jgi:hypothetical protein